VVTERSAWRSVAAWAAAFVACALAFRTIPALDLATAAALREAFGFVEPRRGLVGAFYWVGDTGAKLLYLALSLAAVLALLGVPRVRAWRARLAFLWLALLLGPGLLVNVVLKEGVERPRPHQVVELGGPQAFVPALSAPPPGADGASFVSGHAAFAFWAGALAWASPRRRQRWLWTGAAFGAAMGLTRMLAGAHFLSDVVFAFFAVHACNALAAWIVARLLPPDPDG
jgi:lipid A 4'-phosphatase